MAKSRDNIRNNQSGPGDLQEEMDIYEDEIDLRKYFEVFSRRKKLILSVFFIFVIAAAIVSLCLPKIYKATASIMMTVKSYSRLMLTASWIAVSISMKWTWRPDELLISLTHQLTGMSMPTIRRMVSILLGCLPLGWE